MRGRFWFLASALAGLVVAFAAGWWLAPHDGCHPQVGQSAEEQVLKLVNEYRVQNGVPALRIETRLEAAADWMAQDMTTYNNFMHTDSLGRDPFQRMTAFGYPVAASFTGENLGRDAPSPDELVRLWKSSPAHNANLLDPHFTEAGVGLLSRYEVMDYGSASVQTAVPTPLPPPEPTPTEACR